MSPNIRFYEVFSRESSFIPLKLRGNVETASAAPNDRYMNLPAPHKPYQRMENVTAIS